MSIIMSIIKAVLTALYQYLGASLLFSAMFVFVFLYVRRNGLKTMLQDWWKRFRSDAKFRDVFFAAFLVSMVLFRTVFCRDLWNNPVAHIQGYWGVKRNDEIVYSDNIENLIIQIPMFILFMRLLSSRIMADVPLKFLKTVAVTTFTAVVWSVGIESCQLFFKLGNFYFSDIAYTVLSGFIAGILYYLMYHRGFSYDKRNKEDTAVPLD